MEIKIPMFKPQLSKKAKDLAYKTMSTRWIGQAERVDELENEFKKLFGFQYPVLVNSGTAALDLAVKIINMESKGSLRFFSPILTCTATNQVIINNNCNLEFIDIDKETMNIDYDNLYSMILYRKNNHLLNNTAIMLVHLGGMPILDLDKIYNISEKYNIPIIEDACQALGSQYSDSITTKQGKEKNYFPIVEKWIGDSSKSFVCFSFQAIKSLTTGDGGLLCCPDEETYKLAKRLRWFGIDREAKKGMGWKAWDDLKQELTYDIKESGFKYHMNDIAASIGLGELDTFFSNLNKRKKIAKFYFENINYYDGNVKCLPTEFYNPHNSYWLFPLYIFERAEFMEYMAAYGIETSLCHIRNDLFSIFGGKRWNLPNMNWIEKRYVYVPIRANLLWKEVKYIVKIINQWLKK